MASKIVVIGDINGQLTEVFEKLGKLHAKQSFAFAIVAGNLFADPKTATDTQHDEVDKLLKGAIEIPLPTHFSLGTRDLPVAVIEKLTASSGELCTNLTVLGRKVSIKTSEGFRLAAIGGRHLDTADDQMDEYAAVYTDNDIDKAKKFNDADLLITSEWPANVLAGSSNSYQGTINSSVEGLGGLCTALKPRYHFSTSKRFLEREPFFHDMPFPRSVTRFISLAPYGNTEKQKWIYAFSLEPSAPPPKDYRDCTASPFKVARKRKQDSAGTSSNGHYEHDHHRKRHRAPPATPQECYFCLSNPSCETHMIGSIGEDVYVTIAKGPLSMHRTFPALGFPCHMLIIPVSHTPTIEAIEDKDIRKHCQVEMTRYREALQTMVSAKSTDAEGNAKLGAVTWEISRSGGVHLHWQFLPVPVEMVEDGRVEAGFDVEAENRSYPRFAKKESEVAEAEMGDYFKATLWSENQQKDLVLPLDNSFRFDLQFGRRVLGKLLGLERRMHWRDCAQTQAEEDADATAFKEAFKQYDFSLQ